MISIIGFKDNVYSDITFCGGGQALFNFSEIIKSVSTDYIFPFIVAETQ